MRNTAKVWRVNGMTVGIDIHAQTASKAALMAIYVISPADILVFIEPSFQRKDKSKMQNVNWILFSVDILHSYDGNHEVLNRRHGSVLIFSVYK